MTPTTIKILHLSDLHFGRLDSLVLEDLKNFIQKNKPTLSLIILTGDLTQRAKKNEFLAAKDFLKTIDCPMVLIPGNHDVPLYNIFQRFLFPYRKFCKYLGALAKNFYEDEHLAVYGLWSTDKFSISDGRIHEKDLKNLEEKFRNIPGHKLKIIASHHSVFPSGGEVTKGSERILKLKPHLMLSGHEHQSLVKHIEGKEFPLIISCGTSASKRTRKEANSFNLITINEAKEIWVETFIKDETGFTTGETFKATI